MLSLDPGVGPGKTGERLLSADVQQPWEPSAIRQGIVLTIAVCAVLAVHLSILCFVADNARQSTYYDELAGAFRSGHTFLAEQPPADLIASTDPYNVETLWRTGCKSDASYFHGHYFLYFGPVPALILAGLKMLPVVGRGRSQVPDALLAAGFLVCMTILGALLIKSLRQRVFPDAPWWTVPLAVLAFGLVYPVPALYARLIFYEVAIAAGQCFFIGGLLWTVKSLTAANVRGRSLNALAAGVFFSLAVGSRVSLLLPTSLVLLLYLWATIRLRTGRLLIALAAFLVPLTMTGIGLAAYNYARFGSVTEFGVRYQVQVHQSNYYDIPTGEFTSTSYIWPTFYSYMLRPVLFVAEFPYVRCRIGADPLGLPSSYHRSRTFNDHETTAGALMVSPVVWLGLAPVVFALICWRRRLKTSSAVQNGNVAAADRKINKHRAPDWMAGWVMLALGGSSLLAMAPIVLLQAAITRYPADFMPCMVLCGIAGLWFGNRHLASRPLRCRAWLAVGVGLTLFTALTGAALSANPYYESNAAVRDLQNVTAIEWNGPEYSFDVGDRPARLTVRVARDGFLTLDAFVIPGPQFPHGVPCAVTVTQPDTSNPPVRRVVRFTDSRVKWRIPGIKRGDVVLVFEPLPAESNGSNGPVTPSLHFRHLQVGSVERIKSSSIASWEQPE